MAHRLRSAALSSALRREYDVVVAGGGVVGASVAYHLARAEPSLAVCVVERDPRYSRASAVLSAGGVRQQFSLAPNIELSLYGIDFIRNAHAELAVAGENPPDLQLKEQGYLFLASESGERTLRRNVETQRSCGVDWTTLLTPTEIKFRFPWISTEGVALGCFGEHSEGWFDPWALLMGLRSKARQMGVDFVHGNVTGLGVSHDQMSRQPAITTVHVDQLGHGKADPAVFGAGAVVNAAGAFASNIVRMAGEGVYDLPVRARKRCVFNVKIGPTENASNSSMNALLPSQVSTPLVVDPSGVWFRPEGASGRFICGVSPPAERRDPDCDSLQVLDEVDHDLFDEIIWPALYTRCEAFGALRVVSSWAGFYEYNTLDANAIIGRHPQLQNLILCNGFSGHGLQHAPGAGRAVAELLTMGRYTSIDVSCFGFERVLKSEPIYEQNIV